MSIAKDLGELDVGPCLPNEGGCNEDEKTGKEALSFEGSSKLYR